jgi:hypothetical protein
MLQRLESPVVDGNGDITAEGTAGSESCGNVPIKLACPSRLVNPQPTACTAESHERWQWTDSIATPYSHHP